MAQPALNLNDLPLSLRQVDYIVNSDAFVNLAEGSIRAGKTISCLLRWLIYVATAPRGGDLIVTARTFDTAVRNVFNPLRDPSVFGPYARATSYTRGAPTATILGRQVEVITFNDSRAEGRLRGMTCAGAYVDEWTLMQEAFHEQLIGRCSIDGAQIFGNTNPDNPRHWLKRSYIDEAGPGGRVAGDWKVWKFVLDDNPALSEKVKARYRRQYVGLWFKRMILGQWCVAEGAIFDMWDPTRHVVKTLPLITRWISLGVDYGTVNPFAALMLGVGADGRLYLTHEWRYDSRRAQRQLTDAEYSKRLRTWLAGLAVPGTPHRGITPEWICVDPSAASFRTQLYRDEVTSAQADNAVIDGIRLLASALSGDEPLLRIHESCVGLLNEIPGYAWDPKAAERGEDAPIKVDDHSCDAARYATKTTEAIWRPLVREHLALAA